MANSSTYSFKNILQFIKTSFASEHNDFTQGNITRAIFLLAIPMMLEMVMESVFALVDIYFVGNLGSNAASVVGRVESCMTIIYSLAFGVGMSATAMIARRVGEKDIKQASLSAAQAILVGVFFSLIISLFGVFGSRWMLQAMGADEATTAYGLPYATIMFVGNIVIMMIHLLNGIFRGAGNAAIAMRSLMIANIFNIILCPICVHYWGLTGAAIATTTGRGIGVLYQVWNLYNAKGVLTIMANYFKPSFKILASLAKLSFTTTMQFIVASSSWIAMLQIIAQFGNDAVSGYTYAVRLLLFFLMPAFGLSNAAATLVGQNLGAKQFERAEKSVWLVAKYNAIFMAAVSVVFLLWSNFFVDWMVTSKSQPIMDAANSALRIMSAGYIFYGVGMVMMNAFNGAGDSKTTTLINIFWFWAFQIPIARLIAIKYGYGAGGVFFTIITTEIMVTITSIVIFKMGYWKKVKV